MKTKNRKKLQLSRETLRALDPSALQGVRGARICITGGENTSVPSACGPCDTTDPVLCGPTFGDCTNTCACTYTCDC